MPYDDQNSLPVFEPPEKGFLLFISGDPWQMNATLNFTADMGYGYVEGYRRAAECLITNVEETGRSQDVLVYPIVFLYRHHIELRLKEILDYLHRLGERKDGVPKHHDILKLWNECRPALEPHAGDTEKNWFDAVTECLTQFVSIDPTADAFRYDRRKDGTRSLENLSHINLYVLREHMTKIVDWLDAVSSYLSVWWDNASDAL